MMTYAVYDIVVTEQNENVIHKAKADMMYGYFSSMEELKDYMADDRVRSDDIFYIIRFNDGEPLDVAGMILGCYESRPFYDCAEYDFRVIASIAFGKNLV